MRPELLNTVKFLLILLLAGSLLAGCSQPTLSPTQNPATQVAAVVETLHAQLTETALHNPTATPQPTATALPTATPLPPTLTPTITISPTITLTNPPPLSAQFLYAVTFPENKHEYIPNEKFGLAIGYLNTGTMTWDAGYRLKLVSFKGEVTVQKEAELGKSIAPGKKVEFDLWAFGSETLGQHIWYFQLYSSQGVAIPGGAAVFSYTAK